MVPNRATHYIYTTLIFFQALLNDAYNHKGTIEILTNVGESLMQIVKIEEKGNS